MSDKMIEQVEHQSKIISLKIENFMSIKNALIEFDESNVISLCGYNDSGKSAITRLLEVMLYNTYSTDQVKFITDGESYWTGILTFSDGVEYVRSKYLDGKSFWELRKDNTVLFTNRLPNGTLAAMGDNPDVIMKYLGVIQDELTGEELNVRRNTDKLFLINTSGGDNYKILNTVLRSDVLSNASKSLNDDKNKLVSEISEQNTVKNVLSNQYGELEVAPKVELDSIKSFIANLENVQSQIMRLSLILEENNRVNSITIYDELKGVDITQLYSLQDIINTINGCNYDIYDKLDGVDLERVKALRDIITLKQSVGSDIYEPLEQVDIDRVKVIYELGTLFNTYSGVDKALTDITNKLNSTKEQLVSLSQEHNLKVCKNCGSVVS